MGGLSIGEVAAQAGIAASSLRYYEKIGLLPIQPRRGGRRQFDKTVLDRLRLIELAKSLDFSLKEIALLFDGFSEKSPPGDIWRAFADAKLLHIERQISHAEQLRDILRAGLNCKCLKLDDCVIPQTDS